MSADEIYESLKPKIKKLTRIEKRKLYSKIFSEAHPAFRVKKRGKRRKPIEAREKLERDFQLAFMAENDSRETL